MKIRITPLFSDDSIDAPLYCCVFMGSMLNEFSRSRFFWFHRCGEIETPAAFTESKMKSSNTASSTGF